MKLIKFDNLTCPSLKGVFAPTITLRTKGGCTISHSAADEIGLKAGDKIAFFQDAEDGENWYLAKDGKEGYALRGNYGGEKSKALLVNASACVRRIFESINFSEDTARCRIVTTPIKEDRISYYPILTAQAKEEKSFRRKSKSKSSIQ